MKWEQRARFGMALLRAVLANVDQFTGSPWMGSIVWRKHATMHCKLHDANTKKRSYVYSCSRCMRAPCRHKNWRYHSMSFTHACGYFHYACWHYVSCRLKVTNVFQSLLEGENAFSIIWARKWRHYNLYAFDFVSRNKLPMHPGKFLKRVCAIRRVLIVKIND